MFDDRVIPPAKRAILGQSLKLFASRGVEAVSVRDISAATGFTNPALFRHYAGKEDLARALFEVCYRRLVLALQAASAERGLRGWIAAALGEIEASPESVLFVLDNLKRYFGDLPGELRDRNLPRLVREMIEREQAAGRVRGDVDLPLTVTVLVGALGQIARATHFRDAVLDAEASAERLAGLLLTGLAAPAVVDPQGPRA